MCPHPLAPARVPFHAPAPHRTQYRQGCMEPGCLPPRTQPNSPGEVCHIQISTGGALKYWEGQSLGVVPPGISPKNGKPNSVRLYSICSTRYGDDLAGDSVSLCVRRALYWDKDLAAYDPAKKGVCSNFLCDSKPGDPVEVTGPTGKVMLMPEATPNADLIMIATGTGIAPYRGFLRRLFVEETPAHKAFTGLAWLFLGVANTDSILYDDDWQEVARFLRAIAAAKASVSCRSRACLAGYFTFRTSPRLRRSLLASPIASASPMLFLVRCPSPMVPRSTCRIRSPNMQMKSLHAWMPVHICTSAASRV
mmetsp:Transcript_24602/g.67610  ORF Transcript_24602/g.67610 Transcript_24602/m.67610 type:complete len:308 (-) Transcript_24602:580-1503(-)